MSSFIHLYHQALVDPTGIALPDLEQLLERYPYSQPLYFALERRRFIEGQPSNTVSGRAIMLASSANWLYEYVRSPLEEVPLVEVEDDEYVPYEDLVGVTAEPQIAAEEEETHRPQAEEEAVSAEERDQDEDALETLVQEGVGGGDYFAVYAKDAPAEEEVSSERDSQREEDISLYNDELMPYSFRWWLHKTRLEHADTYQPFANVGLPATDKSPFGPGELDRVILDQQIREHIIHLQNPEEKLSEEVKEKEAHPGLKHKATDVIERFIREEPQIQPPHPENLNVENKARKSSEEQFDLVTETLANIYAEQAMYVKAIEVYKKLILRFPEKKSYFATQIKELEEKLY